MNPTVSAEYHFPDMSQNLKNAAIFLQPSAPAQFLLRLNSLLNTAVLTCEINEGRIEN